MDSAVGSSSLAFNGINTSVSVDGYSGISGANPRTVSAWIKTSATGSLVSWGTQSNGQGFDLRVNNGGDGTWANTLRLDVGGGYIVGSTDIRDGCWHHVAVVFDDTAGADVLDARLYVDGELETISASQSKTVNTAIDGQDVTFGNDQAGRRYNGLLDEVRLYDRALSPAEIAILTSVPNSAPALTAVRPRSPFVEGNPLGVEVDVVDLGATDITDLRVFIDLDGMGDLDAEDPTTTVVAQPGTVFAELDAAALKPGEYTLVVQALDVNGSVLASLSDTIFIGQAPFVSAEGIDVVQVTPNNDVDFDLLRQHQIANPDLALSIGTYSQPTWGTLTLNADGTFNYEPNVDVGLNAGEHDSFTYTVVDSQNNTVATSTAHLFIGDAQDPATFTASGVVDEPTSGDFRYTLTITPGTGIDPTVAGSGLVIDWGDGTVSQPGDITDNEDGTFTSVHALDHDFEVFPVRVFAYDADGGGSGGAIYQAQVTLDQVPVGYVDAESLSLTEVRLRWGDRMIGEAGFDINVSTDGGQTFVFWSSARRTPLRR